MLLDSEFTIAKIRAQQMNEYCEDAKKDHILAKQAKRQPFAIARWARGYLHGLGHLLLTIGRRLDQLDVPPVPFGSIASSRSS